MRGCRGLPRAAGHEGGASLREMSEIRGPPLEPGDFLLGRILSGFPRSFLPLAVCLENTCPLLPGTLVPSLGLALPPPPRTPPGSGPSVLGGCVFFPGVSVHLGPPPRLLSSPAENHRSLQYHLTAVSNPAAGTPAFWVSGWLGPQQYLSYNNLRGQAEPCGAWVWESQVSWYWEKETTDMRTQQGLFLQALQALGEGETGASWAGSLDPGSEGGGDGRPPLLGQAHPCVGIPGPFTMQGLLGCELGPDNVSVPVAKFALNGEEFMMFDPKLGIWDGDWPESRTVSIKWTQQPEAVNKEKTFLLYSCPHRLLGHLERGRGNLEWKGE